MAERLRLRPTRKPGTLGVYGVGSHVNMGFSFKEASAVFR